MSERQKSTKLKIRGDCRQRDLSASVAAWAAQGMSHPQTRSLALTWDEELNKPPLDEDAFKVALDTGWAKAGAVATEDYFRDLSEVETRSVEFVVDPYIPRGTLTILDGHPGQGKSLVTTHLAAAITTGGSFAKRFAVKKGRVLFMAPEDDADRVLRPRLEAQGAAIKRIRFMAQPHWLDDLGRALLRRELIDHRPELVVIDPLPPFISPDTNTYRATEVRGFMQPLALLARELDIAILLVRHLRKGGSDVAIEAGQGSMDFMATVRSGLLVFPHPVDPETKVLTHPKSNWTASGKSLTFEIKAGEGARVPSINWLAELDDTADQLRQGGSRQSVEEAAAAKIAELLVAGPMPAREAIDKLTRLGYSARTVDRAKVAAGVKSGRGPGAAWSLL